MRDAQGNVLSTYKQEKPSSNNSMEINPEEFMIYGSSRLGITRVENSIEESFGTPTNQIPPTPNYVYGSQSGDIILSGVGSVDPAQFTVNAGFRAFVLQGSTYTGKLILNGGTLIIQGTYDNSASTSPLTDITWNSGEIINIGTFINNGMTVPDQSKFTNFGLYRFTTSINPLTIAIGGTVENYNSISSVFITNQGTVKNYASILAPGSITNSGNIQLFGNGGIDRFTTGNLVMLSSGSVQGLGNNFASMNMSQINFSAGASMSGLIKVCASTLIGQSLAAIEGTVTFNCDFEIPEPITSSAGRYASRIGLKTYEMSNHLGNVLTTVSDRKIGMPDLLGNPNLIAYYSAVVLSSTDYYAFGSPMPGRNYQGSGYRYGFNGKENDDETGWQDYGMRMFNPSLGRFFSVDPLSGKYPWYSTYQFAGNKPIWKIDRDGLEEADPAELEAANKKLNDFSNSDRKGIWKNISKEDFVNSLYNIVNDPESLDQGKFSLCGFTATSKGVAIKDPEGFVDNMISLYETGQFASGDNHKIPTSLLEKSVNGDLNAASYVLLMSIKSKYNMSGELLGSDNPGGFLEQCSGITLPSSVTDFVQTYFNVGVVSADYYSFNGTFNNEAYINDANSKNQVVIGLFDWGALREGSTLSKSWHYVQVLGIDKVLTETDTDDQFHTNSKVSLRIYDPTVGNRTIETSYLNYSRSFKWYQVLE